MLLRLLKNLGTGGSLISKFLIDLKLKGFFLNKIKELPNTDYLLTLTQIHDEILDSIKLGLVKFTMYYLHPKLHPNYG